MSAIVPLALLVSAVMLPFGGAAHRNTERGNRHYLATEYEDALRSYTEAQVDAAEAPQLYYDIGNVLYRQGDFEGSAEAYTRALLSAPDDLVGAAAHNLGNARFRQGEFQQAIDAYRRALGAAPDDQGAKRNLELARRALEARQQEPQDPQDQDGEDESESEGEDPQQEEDPGQREGSSPGDESRNPDPSDGEPTKSEPMTREAAERLLDALAEEEQENLRRLAMQRLEARVQTREKDW